MKTSQLIDALKHLPCEDCGQTFIGPAMDFDHDPELGAKLFGIAAGRGRPFAEVVMELEKCSIVCAACHRIRTAKRREAELRPASQSKTPKPLLVEMARRINAVLDDSVEGETVAEIRTRLGLRDDKHIRRALRLHFEIVPGTGTHHIFNPSRFRANPTNTVVTLDPST